MSPPHYLCVFRANQEVQDDVLDLGLDPDFRLPTPNWGICRPQTRHSAGVGSYIIFLGYYKEDQRYLVKGWMRVGEKISYLDALKRYGDRPNIIIREAPQAKSSAPVLWKREELQKETQRLYGTDRPLFLTTIRVKDQVYVQFEEDPHETDNWKCQRMFRCQRKRLQHCITAGTCQRETEFSYLEDYIVAAEDGWQDVGPLRRDWLSVVPTSFRDRPLRTPRGQHNTLLLSGKEVTEIVDALSVLL